MNVSTMPLQVAHVKEPLPPDVLAALDRINSYIITAQINWTSRRNEQRNQAKNSLKVLVMALDALSFAEYMEQREKLAKQAKRAANALVDMQQKRSA